MKKLYLLILFVSFENLVFAQAAPTGYCASQPSSTEYADIDEVIFGSINNKTNCTSLTGSQGTGTGTVDLYTSFVNSSVPIPIVTPGSTTPIDVTIRNCGFGASLNFNYCGQGKVWIDFNRDGVFQDPAEMTTLGGTACFGSFPNPSTLSATVVAPSTISSGFTRMRVTWRMYENTQAAITPCGAGGLTNGTNWGETEDYIVLLGTKKWDYSMNAMLGPDSISFCGQDPVIIKAGYSNTGNQPLSGGRIDLFITGAEPGSTTNLFFNKTWTQTTLLGQKGTVDFPPILFPKDELVKMTFVTYFPLDSNKSNDTLVKFVQVYKNPVYKLKSDTTCADSFNTVQIYDKPLPLFHKWNNESIADITTYNFDSSSSVGIQVSRGWKCNVVDVLPVRVKPLPKLTMARDTVLCNGQNVNLAVSMDLPGSARWNSNSNSTLNVSNSGNYAATGIANNGCQNIGFTVVSVVNPPAQPYILDTVCAGETAKLGLDYTGTDFIYKWTGRTETTPLINPTPAIASGTEKYYVQWWYQGCTSRDSVVLKVNPLPSVTLNFPAPICPFFSSTIVASGAPNFVWRNGFGTNSSITVSPLSTTDYYVKGTDVNGCSKEVMHRQFVYPSPDMKVYSNKFKDNVCLGDSATIYVNGGKTYSWSTGASDSILRVTPTQSFQWTMIGTDNNGCKDTLSYRLNVKPSFSIKYDKTIKGCEGEVVTLRASGSKEYDWGQGPTSDSFNAVTLINSTSYQVTATSPHECQVVASIPVTVFKKPVGQISDLTICKGETGTLEAKGGDTFTWNFDGKNYVTGNGNLGTYTHTDTATIGVEVINVAGCRDTAWTTVIVINTDNQEVVFKSPLDSYNCASPKIPITLSATPAGGVWSGGSYVDGNKLSPAGLNGNIQVLYTFFEPINNCKVERIKTVLFKCTSGISGIDNYDDWSVYPMPFSDKLTVKYRSDKSESADMYIYDLSGREVYHYSHRLLPGENIIDINNLGLAKGTYYLDFQTESVSRQAKMIAQ